MTTEWTPEDIAAEEAKREACWAGGICPDSGATILVCQASCCDCFEPRVYPVSDINYRELSTPDLIAVITADVEARTGQEPPPPWPPTSPHAPDIPEPVDGVTDAPIYGRGWPAVDVPPPTEDQQAP